MAIHSTVQPTLPDPSCPDLDNVVIFISVSSRQRASIVISRTCTEHPRPSHTSSCICGIRTDYFYGLSVYDRTSNERIEVEKALTDDTPDRPAFPNLFAIAPKTMQPVQIRVQISSGTIYASRPEAAIEQKWYGYLFVIRLTDKRVARHVRLRIPGSTTN